MNDTVDTPQRRFAPLLLAAAALLAGRARGRRGARQDDRHTGHDDGRRRVHRLPRQPGEGNAAAGFPRLAHPCRLSVRAACRVRGRQPPEPGHAATLDTADAARRDAVSAYFASLPAPASIVASNDTSIDPANTGAWLATRGRWSQGLPACAQCHGPGGLGVAPRFRRSRQPAAYIAGQLNGWKHGTRPPGPMALMPAIAGKLSDADIDAVAAYYARGGGTRRQAMIDRRTLIRRTRAALLGAAWMPVLAFAATRRMHRPRLPHPRRPRWQRPPNPSRRPPNPRYPPTNSARP